MGLFAYMLGWKKLLDVNITFGDGNCVSVACDTAGADIPSTEYIRLWLQYSAHVIYLLGQVGPDYPEKLLGMLAVLGGEPITPNSCVFPILSNDGALLYSEEINNPDSRIKVKYYVKGSAFRMTNMRTFKTGILIKSVPALFQFAISRNRVDQGSLDTLFYAQSDFMDFCKSEGFESAASMAQVSNQVLIAAAATAHYGENNA